MTTNEAQIAPEEHKATSIYHTSNTTEQIPSSG